jgi:hypothetical protein
VMLRRVGCRKRAAVRVSKVNFLSLGP